MEGRVLLLWSAAALPKIMAGALQESKLNLPVQFPEGRAAVSVQQTHLADCLPS